MYQSRMCELTSTIFRDRGLEGLQIRDTEKLERSCHVFYVIYPSFFLQLTVRLSRYAVNKINSIR